MNKVGGILELITIIGSLPPTDEYVVEGNYETRENIISYLMMNKDWDLSCDSSSSDNTWHLFVNENLKASVSINSGADSFYDDIVLTKFN